MSRLPDSGSTRTAEAASSITASRDAFLASALGMLQHPVCVMGIRGNIEYANSAAEEEYGYDEYTISRLRLEDLVVPLSSREARGILQEGGILEQTHRRKDGSAFPVIATFSRFSAEDGQPMGVVMGVRNLTEERRVTEQLRQTEKLAAIGELVAGVAHELNNPLTGISAFAQLLNEEKLTEQQRESVRMIKREADRAVAVIRDLLIFSRKTGPREADVDVNVLVRHLLRLRSYALRVAEIEVLEQLDPLLPTIRGDDSKLQQVLLNLIVNAEYAMGDVPVRRLVLATYSQNSEVIIRVTDSGTGIPFEIQRQIFEPFFTTKPPGVGTGLGLSVSYGIVQAHGGTISLESAPGTGATFIVRLPCSNTLSVSTT
jgi:two-component system, NtrC family, sensor kinase